MRHGERIDKSVTAMATTKDWSYADPLITKDGCEMAHQYGQLLKTKYIPELE